MLPVFLDCPVLIAPSVFSDNTLIILHIKYTIEKAMTASYLVQQLVRNHFNFPILNFPFIWSNIPEAPTLVIYLYDILEFVVPSIRLLIDGCCYQRSYWSKGS
jgi:hypothetical protein